ncbi:NF-kappa-B inhibitor cactus-like [Centruroides sculpturatus]|uniref:NF-kappa-B inhibitor cactus-like n=1 Tax=Centruroides sculpturatus TaxID=218467 RepID=UPI000C6D4949|nr:NF-kappa-B inhibitor cactus-like [Centruroides sculpturatus]
MKGRSHNKNTFQKTEAIQEYKMEKTENPVKTSEKKLHKHVISDSEKISSYESMRTDSGCSSISFSSSSQFSIDSGMFDSASSISFSKLNISFEKTSSTDDTPALPDSELDEKWGSSTVTHDSGVISDLYSSSVSEIDINSKQQSEQMILKDMNDSFLWKEIFRQDHDGDTLLHIAVIKGSLDLVKSFVQAVPHPDFLDIINDLHQTPLHLAVLTGQPKIARTLVVAGATVDLRDRHGNTALHIACRCGDISCVQALISQIDNKEIEQLNVQYPLYQQYISTELLELRNYEGVKDRENFELYQWDRVQCNLAGSTKHQFVVNSTIILVRI